MKKIIPVNNGSATTVQKSQLRYIIPSLQTRGGSDNNGSSVDDFAPKFIAFIFIFKVKRNSGTNIDNPFSSEALPRFCGNSPPS